MRLLLDEMIPAVVAAELRRGGHDVVALQDGELRHLRGNADLEVLRHAHAGQRAIVTDNVVDLIRCHQRLLGLRELHHGLLLFGNATFPRHRHDRFVAALTVALEAELRAHPGDDDSAWIRWLDPRRRELGSLR